MKKIKVASIIVVSVLLTLTAFMLTGCGSKTLNLNSYLTYEIQGYNGYGTVQTNFDMQAFENDLAKILGVNEIGPDSLSAIGKGMAVEMAANEGTWDKDEYLSNGDTITYDWDINAEYIKQSTGITLKWTKITEKVSGLKEAPGFNPFDYVEVSFSGVSPNGTIKITKDPNRKEMESIIFSANPDSGLKTGDIVTVTASVSGTMDAFAAQYGSIPSVREKEYTVGSLASYVTSVEEISDDIMGKMKSQGEDVFRAYAARWDNPENLVSVNYAGNYFLTAKQDAFTLNKNCVYLIYKIQATNPEPEQLVEFYYPVRFDNIMNLEDGTTSVDLSNYVVPGYLGDSFYVGDYHYYGYETKETMFNNLVVKYIDSFEYSNNLEE